MRRLALLLALATPIVAGCDETSSTQASGPARLGKSDELNAAKHGPTASQVYGNPKKWAGSYVRLTCKITNVLQENGSVPTANAMCGRGVTARLDTSSPNIDYTDPDAVNRAMAKQQRAADQFTRESEDEALLVLTGDRVSQFDGNQIVTVIGPVLGALEGKNAMGATMDFATVRVDYAE